MRLAGIFILTLALLGRVEGVLAQPTCEERVAGLTEQRRLLWQEKEAAALQKHFRFPGSEKNYFAAIYRWVDSGHVKATSARERPERSFQRYQREALYLAEIQQPSRWEDSLTFFQNSSFIGVVESRNEWASHQGFSNFFDYQRQRLMRQTSAEFDEFLKEAARLLNTGPEERSVGGTLGHKEGDHLFEEIENFLKHWAIDFSRADITLDLFQSARKENGLVRAIPQLATESQGAHLVLSASLSFADAAALRGTLFEEAGRLFLRSGVKDVSEAENLSSDLREPALGALFRGLSVSLWQAKAMEQSFTLDRFRSALKASLRRCVRQILFEKSVYEMRPEKRTPRRLANLYRNLQLQWGAEVSGDYSRVRSVLADAQGLSLASLMAETAAWQIIAAFKAQSISPDQVGPLLRNQFVHHRSVGEGVKALTGEALSVKALKAFLTSPESGTRWPILPMGQIESQASSLTHVRLQHEGEIVAEGTQFSKVFASAADAWLRQQRLFSTKP